MDAPPTADNVSGIRDTKPQLMSTGIVWSLVNLSAVGGGLDGRAGSTINEHGDRMVVRRAGVIVQY